MLKPHLLGTLRIDYKLMEHQLPYIRSLGGPLSQATLNKLPGSLANDHTLLEVDQTVQDINQVFTTGDLEGIRFVDHLVQNNADCPNIHALVVFVADEDLGAEVDWGAAEGAPQFAVPAHAPPEVA